jgi:murein DD-endopeptidase MepM/ murein hydrolase activator NlpD
MHTTQHRPRTAILLAVVLVAATACVGPAAAVGAGTTPTGIASTPLESGALHPAAPPTARATGAWIWPLGGPGQITNGFRAPATRYAAGHRGIDFPATWATPVLAPSDGVISFAGPVAGRPVLAVAHAGDLISSFEPVTAAVSTGDRVGKGDVIGTVATGGHCGASCLHFGVRLHGEYVSPLLYLAGVPRAVLLPLLEPVR